MHVTLFYEGLEDFDTRYLGATAKAVDADKLDGLNSTQFARKDIAQTMTGNLNVTGSIAATSNITAFSDRRLKSDLQVIPDALAKVLALTGYTYNRTDFDTTRQTGLIAQDVKTVLPEAVEENKDGIMTLAYGNMVGLLVEAIKELKSEIEELKDASTK